VIGWSSADYLKLRMGLPQAGNEPRSMWDECVDHQNVNRKPVLPQQFLAGSNVLCRDSCIPLRIEHVAHPEGEAEVPIDEKDGCLDNDTFPFRTFCRDARVRNLNVTPAKSKSSQLLGQTCVF
jgi:hypothetical protein